MMRILIKLYWLFISMMTGYPLLAQYYYNGKNYSGDWLIELGGSAGLMNCLTDIGGKRGPGNNFTKDLNWQMTKPSLSLFGEAVYKDAIGIKLETTIGSIRSCDSILKAVSGTTVGRYERNLSFRSTILELQLAAEVHPLFFKRYDQDKAPYWSPYFVASAGFFSFNPQACLNHEWYDLHPLRTEGEGFEEYHDRKPYHLIQFNVPVGIGVRYELSSSINARLEMLYRILFTDYLDDVSKMDYIDPSLFMNYLSPEQALLARQLADRRLSTNNIQRGNPNNNDAYFTIQLKVSATLRPGKKRR